MYTEGPMPLNWANILKQIRSDLTAFVEDGGWNFLLEEQSGSEAEGKKGEKGEESEDSEYHGSEASEDESEESEEEEEESEASAESEGSSEEEPKSGEEEEAGKTWEDLEIEAKMRKL